MHAAVRVLAVVGALLAIPSAVVLLRAADDHDGGLHPAGAAPAVPLSQAFVPPALSDAPGTGGAAEPANPFAGGTRQPLPPRQACLDRIDRRAGIAGYLKSRLQLRPDQEDAWRRLEEAAEPALQAMRDVCAQLPEVADDPPPLPDRIDLAEKSMTARAAFLHAIREPLRQLYDVLTPEQRAVLKPPPGPKDAAL